MKSWVVLTLIRIKCQFFSFTIGGFVDVMFKNQQSAADKAFKEHIKVGAVALLWHLIFVLFPIEP